MPMLHFVAALPAEAQNVGSRQGESASTHNALDKVYRLPSLLLAIAPPLVSLSMCAEGSACQTLASAQIGIFSMIGPHAAWIPLDTPLSRHV